MPCVELAFVPVILAGSANTVQGLVFSMCVRIVNRRALPVYDLHGFFMVSACTLFVFPPCIETQLFTW